MLIRARADLVKARVAAHNQLRAHLQLAHPGVVGLFHELDGKISLAFLTRFPTPRYARWLSEKRLGPGSTPPVTPARTPAPRPSCSTTCDKPRPACPRDRPPTPPRPSPWN